MAALLKDPEIGKKIGGSCVPAATASTTRKRNSSHVRDLLFGSSKKAAIESIQTSAELYGVRFDPSLGEEEDPEEGQEDARERVEKEVESYLQHCKDSYGTQTRLGELMSVYPREATHQWWAKHRTVFPILFQVARAVLSIPASSGNLERDFCDIKQLITPSRTSLSPWTVEMLLLSHSLQNDRKHELSLDEVQELTVEELKKAMPKRVTNADLAKSLDLLDMNEGEIEDFDYVGDVDHLAPWCSVAELAQMWDDFE